MNRWHIVTCEYPPDIGGVSDYTRLVAEALANSGDDVHVWCPPTTASRGTSRVTIHPEAGRFSPSDLRLLGTRLDAFAGPRRLLVQWVPHGYGWRAMNLWLCLWLATRAMAGDRIDLMVHEPFVELKPAPSRQWVMAIVQRLMIVVLMWSATRVWVATPAWAERLKPYTSGRSILIEWLPIPGCLFGETTSAREVRERFDSSRPVVGHFGSFGSEIAFLLEDRLAAIMNSAAAPSLLLIGRGSEAFAEGLAARHPAWSGRVHATGYVAGADVGGYLAACDVLVQPYPDGITSRRTSVMACLSRGCAVVTTSGHLTEPLWEESGAVVLADVADSSAFSAAVTGLLRDSSARRRLARQGQDLYKRRFDVAHTVAAIRAA